MMTDSSFLGGCRELVAWDDAQLCSLALFYKIIDHRMLWLTNQNEIFQSVE